MPSPSFKRIVMFTLRIMLASSLILILGGANFALNANPLPTGTVQVALGSIENLIIKASEDVTETTEIKVYGTVSEEEDAYTKINERIQAFLDEKDLKTGIEANKNGKSIYYATEVVPMNVLHADFEKSKYLAYRKAYQAALGEHVKAIGQRIVTDTVRKAYADNSSGDNLFPEEATKADPTLNSVFEKVIALTGSKLDEALTDMGVNPTQYDAAPKDKKRDLLNNSFVEKTIIEASKSLGGLSVVQTFFEIDNKGEAYIGVIVMYSPSMEGIAKSLRAGQKPAMENIGKPLSVSLPLDNPEALYRTLGPRLMLDENGPVVIAFGQWSNSYKGSNSRLKAEKRKHAEQQADMTATSQISEFLGLSFTTKEESEIGEMQKVTEVKYDADGTIQELDTSSLIDTSLKQAQTKSSHFLQGLSTLKKWNYTTPQGHEVVGVIKIYNFNAIDTVKNMNKPKQVDTSQNNSGSSSGAGAVVPDLNVF